MVKKTLPDARIFPALPDLARVARTTKLLVPNGVSAPSSRSIAWPATTFAAEEKVKERGVEGRECSRRRAAAGNINHLESIRHEGSRADDLAVLRCQVHGAPIVSGRSDGSANYQHSRALSSERDLRRV